MADDPPPGGEFHQLALAKMTTVLGESRARILMTRILDSTGITIETADDLFEFSAELAKHGGFEGAVGAMLNVQAVMHGGRRREPET